MEKLSERQTTTEKRLSHIETKLKTFEENYVSKEIHDKVTNKLHALENQLSKEATKVDIEALIDNKLKSFQRDIESTIQNSNNQAQPKTYKKYQPTTIDELDHDILLIGDSNLRDINEGILKHGKTAAKIMAYKFDEAIEALNNLKIPAPQTR